MLTVYRYYDTISPPKPQVEEVLESVVSSLNQAWHKEKNYVALPQSGALTSSFRQINAVIMGVARSPLSPAGRVKEDAQKRGTHISLTMPLLRQYRAEYYQIANDARKDVRVNTPTMIKGRSQLDTETVVCDRRIASKRIHVEIIIGYAKTFKIFVCFMLTNFRL